MRVIKINSSDWAESSEYAHITCFNEKRPAEMERIDFALLAIDEKPQAYCTVRELDSESAYWQFGGSFPEARDTIKSFKAYSMFRNWMKEAGYKRISTYVKNDNIVMLKMAFKIGYRIIGTRTFKNEIYVELLNDLAGDT